MYPFSAIVGQENLKQALLICAVNPRIGGLLISGDKGTAKSTAVRALAQLLPAISVRQGCRFNCSPDTDAGACFDCQTDQSDLRAVAIRQAPLIDLPLGATEDRVVGALDFERALQSGEKAFQPGLLAFAHRGILYIDEVNLLADHLVDLLLDVAASGINRVEREAMALSHSSSFTLIGSMNPEEGELRPQFLDRFSMMVTVEASLVPDQRAEVVRRHVDFETSPTTFVRAFSQEQSALGDRIASARALLPGVSLDDRQLSLVSQICAELEVKSLRADIFINKVARTQAALDLRQSVSARDIRLACQLVLAHRLPKRRSRDDDKESQLQNKLNDLLPPDEPEELEDHDPSYIGGDPTGGDGSENQAPIQVADLGGLVLDRAQPGSAGKRSKVLSSNRGAFREAMRVSEIDGNGSRALAVTATIANSVVRNGGTLSVTCEDMRVRRREAKTGNLILLVVDGSGSMAALERMRLVKGTVLALLQDAYQKRDKVAVVVFRGRKAELVLAPTRSFLQAEEQLSNLETGGTTPLSAALELTWQVIESRPESDLEPLVVLFTDGRANVSSRDVAEDPVAEALEAARVFGENDVAALVLDTESGAVRLGRAGSLAEAMACECLALEELSAADLVRIIAGKRRAAPRRAGRPS